jgi:predicted amidohydrolase YtcJ
MPSAAGKTALAVTSGKIVAVGDDRTVLAFAGPKTRAVDLDNRVVIPGLIDSHIHFQSGGLAEERLKLQGAPDVAQLLARIKTYAEAHPELKWILGRGWSYDLFKGAMPTRQMLDAVVPDRPVLLGAYDGHTAWANSAALNIAGVDGSGALVEDAMGAVYEHVPPPSAEEKQGAVLAAQTLALRAGLTAVNDFAAGPETYETYAALEKAGKLIVRVYFSPPLETPLAEVLAQKNRIERESKRVKFGTLKGFVDGVIESNTAAFVAPYADAKKHKGVPHLDAQALDALILPADKAGLSVSLHAVGDGAVRLALDAYERAANQNGTRDRRHRVEHVEVLHKDDAKRFKALGVAASMQPFHAEPSDAPGQGVWEKKVGPQRLPFIFPWKLVKDAGGVLAFGSDWTVFTLDPLKGLAVAIATLLYLAGFCLNARLLPRRILTPVG